MRPHPICSTTIRVPKVDVHTGSTTTPGPYEVVSTEPTAGPGPAPAPALLRPALPSAATAGGVVPCGDKEYGLLVTWPGMALGESKDSTGTPADADTALGSASVPVGERGAGAGVAGGALGAGLGADAKALLAALPLKGTSSSPGDSEVKSL